MNKKEKLESNTVFLQFQLSGDLSHKLRKSAEISNRSLRQEAIIRLSDHLNRHDAIATVGQTSSR